MQLAGEAAAKLALALAPHARIFWIACGPGNNGGDGFVAAAHLQSLGKAVVISYIPAPDAPADATHAREAARHQNISFTESIPEDFDFCIDALFGIGRLRPWSLPHAQWMEAMNRGGKPVLALDLPSGLDADTGAATGLHVRATHTLSLLTLKPGLFTAMGRDACGDIWFNALGIAPEIAANALLIPAPVDIGRLHGTSKGSFGDLAVVGGSAGMQGAAMLAAGAALRAGAGRVYVALLDAAAPRFDASEPELMFRDLHALALPKLTVVAGCGGGETIAAHLPELFLQARSLVVDADALNCIAQSPELQSQLRQRNSGTTVMTPHPLEAARLAGLDVRDVQSHRHEVACTLAEKFNATVVLKGSGSVVAAPGEIPRINPTGNGRLATAGTGDVLAGLIGARLAQGQPALEAACDAVYLHGQIADRWPDQRLTASSLSHALTQ
jgi:hydroxyethylthiazole kinase-like uncharacterized protein yjeF